MDDLGSDAFRVVLLALVVGFNLCLHLVDVDVHNAALLSFKNLLSGRTGESGRSRFLVGTDDRG